MIKEKIQSFMISVGNYACYALSIIKIAEEVNNSHIDVIVALESAIEKGYIYFNVDNYSDDNNFYVERPEKFLSHLTGDIWIVRHDKADYKPKDHEKIVQRWERKSTGKTISHFRLPEWDSLENSQTVQFGKIASVRVFTNIG